ncbi:flagellar assembly factor FliW [Robertmurraya siralis]|uniref:Flagellar assembly factor FliW n=1 Tax=Robertmurraya siralis TaxID=77777 RepID=A0A919WLT1_9BACI|nr:flagellar assembly protein FliW [Robertmurraya siralis]GIN64073.1 flagellar assembly factor FliW [Robertmurraya siralis]
MKIATKYHGEIEIDQANIIHFNSGIPSFLEEKQFYVLPFADDGPFFILQSIQTPSLAFVIVSPFEFFPGYELKLPEHVVEALEIAQAEDVATFVILTVQEPFQNTTANLQGPIVINNKKKLGKQVILSDSSYTTKHLLVQTAAATGKEG